jgi:hypothetical protein
VCTNIHYESSFVKLPDNFLEIIKGMRESPSLDLPGKLCKVNTFEERLTEKCRLEEN